MIKSTTTFLFGAALLAAATVTTTNAGEIPFTSCADEDLLGVEKIAISEDSLHPGHEVDFSVVFKPEQDIPGGILSLSLYVRNMKVIEESIDMCADTSLECPLKSGQEVTASTSQTIPKGAPPAKLKVVVQAAAPDGSSLSCIQSEIQIEPNEDYTLEEMANLPAVDSALLAQLSMTPKTWTSDWSPRFANATLKQARGLMGTVLRGHPLFMDLPLKEEVFGDVIEEGADPNATIPDSFDAREAWPDCAMIGHARDQSACGSCWAFATSTALEDRHCIVYGEKELLSPTDTLACCSGMECGFSQGCNGGQPAGAWTFFTTTGCATGGDFDEIGSAKSCLPYPFPPCAHHIEPTPENPACPAEDYETPSCPRRCSEDDYETYYQADKRMAKRGYSVRGVEKIQKEIMENGPVSVAFNVYQDFLTYSGGVYQHESGAALGGHAVKMIGWGVEDNVPYWLITNSWGPGWGINGHFKIIRGQDECGIESQVTAGSV